MNILGKPGISFGSITYRRKYTSVVRIFFLALQVVRSRSGLEVYREADWKSIASYYCFPSFWFFDKKTIGKKLWLND
jgi:hypothetical protein